jgi:hypothetical protein
LRLDWQHRQRPPALFSLSRVSAQRRGFWRLFWPQTVTGSRSFDGLRAAGGGFGVAVSVRLAIGSVSLFSQHDREKMLLSGQMHHWRVPATRLGGRNASPSEASQSLPQLQLLTRGHPPCGDDVCLGRVAVAHRLKPRNLCPDCKIRRFLAMRLTAPGWVIRRWVSISDEPSRQPARLPARRVRRRHRPVRASPGRSRLPPGPAGRSAAR